MDYEPYMKEALAEAKLAFWNGDVPVGAVIVKDGAILGRGHNTREKNNEIHGHAEINAILDAEKKLGSWILEGCSLVVTLEPCPMCAGAILQSRISTVVFGADDAENGALRSKFHLFDGQSGPSRPLVYGGLLNEECQKLLRAFFQNLREGRKENQ